MFQVLRVLMIVQFLRFVLRPLVSIAVFYAWEKSSHGVIKRRNIIFRIETASNEKQKRLCSMSSCNNDDACGIFEA
jgi:hypothetical protein